MPREPLCIALDLETTGLDPASDRVVEIGALVFDADGLVVETFERLINPGRPIAAAARAINGILDSDLAEAPPAADVLPDFVHLLGRTPDAPLLAHNAAFDAGFLGMELTRAGMAIPDRPVLDTLPLARAALPELRSHRLDLLVAHFGIAPQARHRALSDAAAVMDLWLRLDGPAADDVARVSYPIHDGSRPVRPPIGWERLDEALGRGRPVRIAYDGGTRGDVPRIITPRSFAHRGGVAYVVATCHIDSVEKSFRLDRIRTYEVLEGPGARP
ncbi:exonuclease domain-containing protein [Paludisphaera mucosa]|uniref:Exonuclease domain-containing protein n=1 Tax=Paludisphaera mucosa TaxID=3030827 RepID=A0ABT6F8H5_9BACT|nr:exonuclease domain-containing protein [Paludisphaera mucosa]MDG3003894.1 exonuclease domain-containing protein [Paludisphaera mucosa]